MDSKSYQHIVHSAIAGCIAECLMLPLCTIKTVYQTTQSNSIIATAKSIYKQHHIKGFYNASLPAIASQTYTGSSRYFLYHFFNDFSYLDHLGGAKSYVCGMLSGIFTSMVTHPFDNLKNHLQIKKPMRHNTNESIRQILYRGYSKTFLKTSIGSSIYLPVYYTVKNNIDNTIISAATSSAIMVTVLHPIDYLKTQHICGSKWEWFRGYDIRNYYKGYTIQLIRIVPHSIITMSVIEYLMSLNNKRGL